MLYLQANAGEQILYLTLQQAAHDYAYTHYLFKLVNRVTQEDFYFVADVETDNPRYTAVAISTNISTVNDVLLTEPGDYDYFVYAQNSASNLDPANASVVALISQGTLRINGQPQTQFSSISLDDNIVFYE